MKNPGVKYNVNFLKDKATKDQFNITLSNKFQILEELDNIEDQWSQIKDVINNTCEETLGRKSYTQKEWITPETLRKVQEKKNRRIVQLTAAELEKKRQQLKQNTTKLTECKKKLENIHRKSCCTSRKSCKYEEYERSI